jgi:chromosome segregation protein
MLDLVHCGDVAAQAVLSELLAHCYVASSLDEAIARRDSLPAGGRFVVREGHQVGRNLFLFHAADSEQEGVLARMHEIENLSREQRAQQLLVDDARAHAVRIEADAAQSLEELARIREEHAQCTRQLARDRMVVQSLLDQAGRARADQQRIDNELAEIALQSEEREAELAALQETFEGFDADLAQLQDRVEQCQIELEQSEQAVADHRERLRQAERASQESIFEARTVAAEIERLTRHIEATEALLESLAAERVTVEDKIASSSDQEIRVALDDALGRRVSAESALAAGRARMESLGQALREKEDARLNLERSQEPMRVRMTELQLQEQAARLNAEQFTVQLSEAGVDDAALAALSNDLAQSPVKAGWLQGELNRLGQAITALGPVNMAALEELREASERHQFLTSQFSDLTEAIETLEDAIRKIDRETRELLRETYETVNRHFGELFPRLFGGGEARLILTGDEILDAGVQVMAQPPGKRNTSIHLLSGGEKALTAIALVFGLFQLNPAPFCLLDEVDAPLDDANTERYADMVKAMSAQTQFLFISHNKIAMEIAEQLIGVTMQEKGVSRIVAVDLQAAAQLAEAA